MTIGIIGAGNMASALARGWAEPILVTDSGSGRAAQLAAQVGGEALASNLELAKRAELVVLCHKPAQVANVAAEIADHARAVVSVLATIQLGQLRALYRGVPVARVMPNTAVEVRQGVTCLALDDDHDSQFAQHTRSLFERLGTVVELPEHLIHVATGVSGVAPAYVALIAEAQVDAAVREGMPADRAGELVAASLAGSAALLRARGNDTLAVRREVASPGGVTARGLEALERAGLRTAFANAMSAVVARAAR